MAIFPSREWVEAVLQAAEKSEKYEVQGGSKGLGRRFSKHNRG